MSDELSTLFEDLVTLVSKTVPRAESYEKYGGIVFTIKPDEKEGQFCGVFPYASHVQLSFSKGAQLEAFTELRLGGSGKFRRHINFKSAETINSKALKILILQSVDL